MVGHVYKCKALHDGKHDDAHVASLNDIWSDSVETVNPKNVFGG